MAIPLSPKALFLLSCILLTLATGHKDPVFSKIVTPLGNHDHQGHDCMHDQLEQMKRDANYVEPVLDIPLDIKFPDGSEKRVYQANDPNRPEHRPLRVHIEDYYLENDPEHTCYSEGQTVDAIQNGVMASYTCRSEDVLTQSKRDYLYQTLMGKAVDILYEMLYVVRSSGNMRLNINSCGVPPLAVTVPSSYTSTGIDADFVLFITSRPILGSGALAFASSCASNGLGRPIAGHANFNTSSLFDVEGDIPRQLGIAVHEISHALGFSSSRFNSFIEWLPDGSFQKKSSELRLVTDAETGIPGYTYTEIRSPEVVKAVREHFGCDDLTGAPLEDGGASGTAGSHWEKRIFMSEYMTGTESPWPVYSILTLSLFYDSGWYDVDWDKAESLEWGYHMGCEFVRGDCADWDEEIKCDSVDLSSGITNECSFDLRGHGQCNLRQYSEEISPDYFQHWPDDPTKGGHSIISDYCGYVVPSVQCSIGTESVYTLTDIVDSTGILENGEFFGVESRCMKSTLNKVSGGINFDNFGLSPPAIQAPRCYPMRCTSKTSIKVQVDEIWYDCITATEADTKVVRAFDYGGEVTCPSSSKIEKMCSRYVDEGEIWPRIKSVRPIKGPPGTRITIYGSGFSATDEMEVWVEGQCTDVVILNDTHLEADIPGGEFFVGIADLAFFQSRKNVWVRDGEGRTGTRADGFIVRVAFDAEYFKFLFQWMGDNPLWALLGWAVAIIPPALLIYCCCRGVQEPKKPSKERNHHHQQNTDQYYDDNYDVDDYYDDFYFEEDMARAARSRSRK
eukprot:TRINITY_DN5715_c0_g1_i1.p1 TRINITY_DN5715_c0_g1~~TRINITY_DN5715_c0_g1_i1.p1  ORF type:complete len:798 (+),score=190.10 TRINITY_DN5715_c0_g1_i1:25-2394(+)